MEQAWADAEAAIKDRITRERAPNEKEEEVR